MRDEIAIVRKKFKVCRREIRGILKVLREKGAWEFPKGSLSIAFVGDRETCELHDSFLNDPSKTDVITFPGDEVFTKPIRREEHSRKLMKSPTKEQAPQDEEAFAGEIVICVDQALRAAKQFETSPQDELLLYLIHGFLHLAGLDDLAEETRAEMRAAEAEAIALLKTCGKAPLTRVTFPEDYNPCFS